MKPFKIIPVRATLSALILLFCLCGCGSNGKPTAAPTAHVPATEEAAEDPTEPVTEAPTEPDPLAQVEQLAIVVTEQDIFQLEYYPNLKQLDLTGSTCYTAIAKYIQAHPEVEVTYTVSLGPTTVDNHTAELTLNPGDYDAATLLENLPYLPQLTALSMPKTTLTAEELDSLREACPELSVSYTVDLLGTEYSSDTTELDLSFLTPAQAEEVVPALSRLNNVTYIELMNGSNSKLSKEDVKILVDAAPWANVHYTFTLFGQTISTTDEKVEYVNVNIGDTGEPEIRAALDIMTGCTYFKLENCKIDNVLLARMRDDYRDKGIKIVWRIWFGKYTVLTDTEKIRAVYNVFDDTCHDLRYCEDVKYIDMGHNDTLTDLSFIGYMPNLEILIVSGCAAKELPGFENCKKLEFLELANCGYLEDISSLAGCESLKYLNLSYTRVTDLMPLDGLPLERFCCLGPKASVDERNIFLEIHPDCWTRFTGTQPYGIGWRYDDNGMTYSEIYRKVRDIFGYDDMPT